MRRRTIFLVSVAVIGAILGGAVFLHYVVFQPVTGSSGSTLHVSQPQTTYTGNRSVIAFEELAPDQQRVFERALENDSGYADIPTDVNSSVWVENRAIQYRNQTYTVAVGKG